MINQRRMAILRNLRNAIGYHKSVSKTTRKECKFYNHLEMNPIVWMPTDMENNCMDAHWKNKSVNEVVVILEPHLS